MLSEKLLSFALVGIDPVLWVLVSMSVIAVGVIIERLLAFGAIQKNYQSIDYYTLRLSLEAHLGILATFGNNAPFIGLFGTVLGIIQAFHMIGSSNAFDVQPIMQGISEALIATATGLFVAIPCVIAYNYFTRRVKVVLTQKEAQLNEA
ncbi:MotA/TolQ/ExbB proton channel family protein [Sulfurospirillum diekertiae]|uniref:MotA/TolQ/ExbB proton channel family protein n=1 Tax=Sulfurospirillum diekertiae TaxID=1854492 RepID=A0A6G9VQV4_9BACT|nr:MotA/TolQ/ExbB proton channel family protein [Sulfurospirillum diekertiae]QIR75732.1 MotA/TolQ/ExbB proton channel family protein [Sulfurospirillum diekertiae]QIR78379.1 MotA/TolQ/ExbB proton channel family protein [Sulfurospirillum diekertiae]